MRSIIKNKIASFIQVLKHFLIGRISEHKPTSQVAYEMNISLTDLFNRMNRELKKAKLVLLY